LNKKELPEEWKQPITVPICKKVDKTNGRSIEAYHLYQLLTKFYPKFWCQGSLNKQRKLLGIIRVDFDATVELLIIFDEQETNLMSQFIKFYFTSSTLNMFRTLIHPSSGACDFSNCITTLVVCLCVLASMCVGVSVWLGWGGIHVAG